MITVSKHRTTAGLAGVLILAMTAAALLSGAAPSSPADAAQPQPGQPVVTPVSTVEVLLRIEQQLIQNNERLARIEEKLRGDVPVRIVEPLPPGLRLAPAPKPPVSPAAGDRPDPSPRTP